MDQGIFNKIGIIKGISGDGDTFLVNQVTNSQFIPLNSVYVFLVSGLKNEWLLRTGSESSNGTSIQRPFDYDSLTNAVVWERIT